MMFYYTMVFAVLLQAAVVHFGSAQAATQAETCEAQATNPTWNRMEVLPGTGWDNLRNQDMGLVFEYDYTQCQLTTDRKFLLPDGYFAIPMQQSDVETFSELIVHWQNHTSVTSTSINAGASFFSVIDGTYSKEYTKVKTTMYNQNSIIARVQIRHKLYVIRLQPGTKLNLMFKTRLLDIAAHMMSNNSQTAHYLSELLIRDYGTHYLTAAHAGAILVQEDFIGSNFALNYADNQKKLRLPRVPVFLEKLDLVQALLTLLMISSWSTI